MILLSGKYKDHKFIWYSKFTGFKCSSENGENFPFFEHSDLLNDMIQFTANYIYEKIRKANPSMKKKDVRSIVVEAFKDSNTMICFEGYSINKLPYLYIEFFNNPIMKEFIANTEIIRFRTSMHTKHKIITDGSRTITTDDFTINVNYYIQYVTTGAAGNRNTTYALENTTTYWDKNLKYKIKE